MAVGRDVAVKYVGIAVAQTGYHVFVYIIVERDGGVVRAAAVNSGLMT